MRYVHYLLVIAAALALTACGKSNNAAAILGVAVINLNGGNGGSAAGGNGGSITTLAVHGDLKFHAIVPVLDTGFVIPTLAPNFGGNPATITTTTLVASSVSTTPGTLYITSTPGDHTLYLVNQAGTGIPVTGLTVNAGATLSLPNVNGFTLIPQAVIINGTVTTTKDGETLDLRSGSYLVINGSGKVTTTPAGAGTDSGQLKLFSGGVLLNGGTVESNGRTGTNENSNGITLEATTFLYNIGAISARGDGTGNGGPIQLQADTASLYTGTTIPTQINGTIDASGGNGGGNGGAITLFGGNPPVPANGVGRVVVVGPVTSNGGNGSAGNGGAGGAITVNSFSGAVLVSANISATGGNGSGNSNGGKGGSLQLINNLGSDTANQHQISPEGIKITGNITLNGGAGSAGGAGGALSFSSNFANNALPGFANVEFFGYQSVTLNGGNSTGGNGGNGGTVSLTVSSSDTIAGVDFPAGGVSNEVTISARGGDNTPKSIGSSGGKGGSLQFMTPLVNGSSDPTRTLVTNSGLIDVSGGAGDTGGGQGNVTIASFGNLTNLGTIIANGGTGSTQGGGIPAAAIPSQNIFVSLSSSNSIFNSGAISAVGGSGTAGGNAGGIVLASGNQTSNSAAIVASGGGGTAGGSNGNGGFISLMAELAYFPSVGSLNVAKGIGGPANTGKVGTILIGGVDVTSSTGVI